MDGTQFVISILSGGLAGAGISAIANRIFHWRALRTQFHPKLNNIFGEYFIRMEEPGGRYWIGNVGYLPSVEDTAFVNCRSEFINILPQFNELREARELWRILLTNPNPDHAAMGKVIKTDLMPEYQAISACLDSVQKKLKL